MNQIIGTFIFIWCLIILYLFEFNIFINTFRKTLGIWMLLIIAITLYNLLTDGDRKK